MRQKVNYDSGDYSWSIIFWVFIFFICICCFWWVPGGNTTATDAAANAANYNANYGWGWGSGWGWSWWWWIIIFFLIIWCCSTLFYAPVDVSADDDEVRVRRVLKSKRIPYSEIESAAPYQASRKPKRKGFKAMPFRSFGRWGHYSDDNIGDYFAYYGKPDSCVLITMKDGKKYVIGCQDPKQFSEYINSKLGK